MTTATPPSDGKRTDVGYKRPPVEHQFKPGNKPPPRKKRPAKPATPIQLLIKILDEEQRVEIGGKVHWYTKGRLLLMVAFKLAEQGNSTLSRALVTLLLKDGHSAQVSEPWLQLQEQDGTWGTYTLRGEAICCDG